MKNNESIICIEKFLENEIFLKIYMYVCTGIKKKMVNLFLTINILTNFFLQFLNGGVNILDFFFVHRTPSLHSVFLRKIFGRKKKLQQ